jgi:hypothetical protein
MFNWFDLMRQAQQSAGTAMLAKQFHLDPGQAQAAMAAFLPAFAMGVQHTMGTKPADTMVQNLFGGAYQNLWLNAAQAFTPGAQRNGEQILDRIFGSDETSRRVAQQAAAMTGVNADVMQQMMPVLAGIYAGGLYHWVSGHARAMNNAAQPDPQPVAVPDFAEAWLRMCGAWTGQESPTPEPEPQPAATPFETMLAGFLPSAPDQREPVKARRNKKSPENPPAWEDMMAKGRDMQEQYLASLQTIFDEAERSTAKKR